MSKQGVIRLTLYLIIILVVVEAGIIARFYTNNWIVSEKAELKGTLQEVGVNYRSVVEESFVQQDQLLKEGDVMFVMRSNKLTQALKEGKTSRSDLLYDLNEEGEILIKSPSRARVSDVKVQEGDFVKSGSEVAELRLVGSAKIRSTFDISHRRAQDLTKDSVVNVTFPNGREIETEITNKSFTVKRGADSDARKPQVVLTSVVPESEQELLLQWKNETPVDSKLLFNKNYSILFPVKVQLANIL